MSLSRALSKFNHFTPLLVHMINAGEITGKLPAMLERAAKTQEDELERNTMALANVLEPFLILLMGFFVMMIVLAVLMPIIEVNQLLR